MLYAGNSETQILDFSQIYFSQIITLENHEKYDNQTILLLYPQGCHKLTRLMSFLQKLVLTCMRVEQTGFLEEVVVPHGLVPVEGHVLASDHGPLFRRR